MPQEKQLLKFISILFCGILATTTVSARNDNDSISQNSTNAPLQLFKNSINDTVKNEGNGIKGKLMISSGFGFNALRPLLIIKYDNLYTQSNRDAHVSNSNWLGFTPIINLGVDYGLAKRFSVGMAFGYQQVSITTNNLVTDTWTRIQVTVRGDYYIIADENRSVYIGLKVGYNNYSVTYSDSQSIYSAYSSNAIAQPLPIAVQAHFGYSYYFNKLIGINTEVALAVGGPDYFALGITFKL